MEKELLQTTQRKSIEFPPPNQILVFCGTVKMTKRVGELLNCPIYFKDEESTRKTEVFNELTRNINPIFVITNVLGFGIDISTV